MLSLIDIYREMGKNIYVTPLNNNNLRDNSIDLTASNYAWRLITKINPDTQEITYEGKSLVEGDEIVVPPHETACIVTKEAIYVSEKIGGTLHSRVRLTFNGFGHIGTTLDPKYYGQCLIMLQNTKNEELRIKVGERIVSVIFYYLRTPITKEVRYTPPSHSEKIKTLATSSEYMKWEDENSWTRNYEQIITHFENNDKEEFEKRRKQFFLHQYGWFRNFITLNRRDLIWICIFILILAGSTLIGGIAIQEILRLVVVAFIGSIVSRLIK